jgi:hypothetical protein
MSAIQQYQGHFDVQISKSAVERRVFPIGFRWGVHKRLFNSHDKALGVGERLHIVISLDVSVFWDVTLHTLAQIY